MQFSLASDELFALSSTERLDLSPIVQPLAGVLLQSGWTIYSWHCPFHLWPTPQASLTSITSQSSLCLTSSPRGPHFLAFFQDSAWLTKSLPQRRYETFLDGLLGHSQMGQRPLPTVGFGCPSSTYMLNYHFVMVIKMWTQSGWERTNTSQ